MPLTMRISSETGWAATSCGTSPGGGLFITIPSSALPQKKIKNFCENPDRSHTRCSVWKATFSYAQTKTLPTIQWLLSISMLSQHRAMDFSFFYNIFLHYLLFSIIEYQKKKKKIQTNTVGLFKQQVTFLYRYNHCYKNQLKLQAELFNLFNS